MYSCYCLWVLVSILKSHGELIGTGIVVYYPIMSACIHVKMSETSKQMFVYVYMSY